jgi:hypothetical protein
MHRRVNGTKFLFLIILIMTGCNGFSDVIISSDNGAAPSPWATINSPGVGTPPSLLDIPEPSTPTVSPKPPTPTIPPRGSERFHIGQRSYSDREVMQGIALVLHSAELSADELSLRIGFENTTNHTFSLVGRFEKHHVVLLDAAGYAYEPLWISQNLRQLSPTDGFAPGEANVGHLDFPQPIGSEPYELRLSRFAPIRFNLDIPLPDEVAKVPPDDYPLDVSLHSTDQMLAHIELRVQSVRVEANRLTFSIGLVNTSPQGNGLSGGPTAEDAWVRDAEGVHYKPIAMSESLQDSMAPKHGWEPGQEHIGTLTFPQPEAISEVSFIFPLYHKLTIYFDKMGVAEVRVADGDAVVPAPPKPAQ